MPVPGVRSILRSLVLGTAFAALVLAVSAGVLWTGLRGQTDEGYSSYEEAWQPLSAPAESVSPASRRRSSEPELQHLTPIIPSFSPGLSEIQRTEGTLPFAPRNAGADSPGSSPSFPEAPPPAPVGTQYEDPLPEGEPNGTPRDTTTERDSIAIDADFAQEWTEDKDKIAVLRGRCRVVQGNTTLFGQKMVIWQRTDPSQSIKRERLIIYVEDDVLLDRPGQSLSEQSLFLNLVTTNGVTLNARHREQGKPAAEDSLYLRAKARKDSASRTVLDPTQLVVPNDGSEELRSVQIPAPAGAFRRVRIFPRYGVPIQRPEF